MKRPLTLPLILILLTFSFSTSYPSSLPLNWIQIFPEPTVWMGREVHPSCSGGPTCSGLPPSCYPGDTTFSFFVKGGPLNHLVLFFNGGGACWDSMNCLYFGTYSKEIGVTVDSLNHAGGIFDAKNPSNPFKNWNFVFIPYCTGDFHWGSRDEPYPDELNRFEGEAVTIHHRGFDNFWVVLKWMMEHFIAPEKIFVTGSSAGSFGALLGFTYIQKAYPDSEVNLLGDSGVGVLSEDFRNNDIHHWGFEQNMPFWIPGFNRPFSEYSISEMYKMIADAYPQSKIAQYSTAYDSTQILFYNMMLNTDNPWEWKKTSSVRCDWHNQMVAYIGEAAEASNYRYYIGKGEDHTVMGSRKFYKEDSADLSFVEWVTSMVGNPDTLPWENGACEGCMDLCR